MHSEASNVIQIMFYAMGLIPYMLRFYVHVFCNVTVQA